MIDHDSHRHSEDNRRPEEIESDLDRTRAAVSSTIDAIQNRLTPGQMMDQAFAYARTSLPADFGANLGNTVRDNPMPVALVGVGLAWLMASGRHADGHARLRHQETDDSNESRMHQAASTISEKGNQLKDRASETGHSMRDKAGGLKQRISESASSMTERARSMTHQAGDLGRRSQGQYHRAKDGFSRMFDEQPLMVGVLGIALGTILGAALPRTQREDQTMGHMRDELLKKAKSTASEQADRIKESAKHGAQGAKNEAEGIGDGVGAAVGANTSQTEGAPGQHGYH